MWVISRWWMVSGVSNKPDGFWGLNEWMVSGGLMDCVVWLMVCVFYVVCAVLFVLFDWHV